MAGKQTSQTQQLQLQLPSPMQQQLQLQGAVAVLDVPWSPMSIGNRNSSQRSHSFRFPSEQEMRFRQSQRSSANSNGDRNNYNRNSFGVGDIYRNSISNYGGTVRASARDRSSTESTENSMSNSNQHNKLLQRLSAHSDFGDFSDFRGISSQSASSPEEYFQQMQLQQELNFKTMKSQSTLPVELVEQKDQKGLDLEVDLPVPSSLGSDLESRAHGRSRSRSRSRSHSRSHSRSQSHEYDTYNPYIGKGMLNQNHVGVHVHDIDHSNTLNKNIDHGIIGNDSRRHTLRALTQETHSADRDSQNTNTNRNTHGLDEQTVSVAVDQEQEQDLDARFRNWNQSQRQLNNDYDNTNTNMHSNSKQQSVQKQKKSPSTSTPRSAKNKKSNHCAKIWIFVIFCLVVLGILFALIGTLCSTSFSESIAACCACTKGKQNQDQGQGQDQPGSTKSKNWKEWWSFRKWQYQQNKNLTSEGGNNNSSASRQFGTSENAASAWHMANDSTCDNIDVDIHTESEYGSDRWWWMQQQSGKYLGADRIGNRNDKFDILSFISSEGTEGGNSESLSKRQNERSRSNYKGENNRTNKKWTKSKTKGGRKNKSNRNQQEEQDSSTSQREKIKLNKKKSKKKNDDKQKYDNKYDSDSESESDTASINSGEETEENTNNSSSEDEWVNKHKLIALFFGKLQQSDTLKNLNLNINPDPEYLKKIKHWIDRIAENITKQHQNQKGLDLDLHLSQLPCSAWIQNLLKSLFVGIHSLYSFLGSWQFLKLRLQTGPVWSPAVDRWGNELPDPFVGSKRSKSGNSNSNKSVQKKGKNEVWEMRVSGNIRKLNRPRNFTNASIYVPPHYHRVDFFPDFKYKYNSTDGFKLRSLNVGDDLWHLGDELSVSASTQNQNQTLQSKSTGLVYQSQCKCSHNKVSLVKDALGINFSKDNVPAEILKIWKWGNILNQNYKQQDVANGAGKTIYLKEWSDLKWPIFDTELLKKSNGFISHFIQIQNQRTSSSDKINKIKIRNQLIQVVKKVFEGFLKFVQDNRKLQDEQVKNKKVQLQAVAEQKWANLTQQNYFQKMRELVVIWGEREGQQQYQMQLDELERYSQLLTAVAGNTFGQSCVKGTQKKTHKQVKNIKTEQRNDSCAAFVEAQIKNVKTALNEMHAAREPESLYESLNTAEIGLEDAVAAAVHDITKSNPTSICKELSACHKQIQKLLTSKSKTGLGLQGLGSGTTGSGVKSSKNIDLNVPFYRQNIKDRNSKLLTLEAALSKLEKLLTLGAV